MHYRLPKETELRTCVRVDNRVHGNNPDYRRALMATMREALAEQIVHTKVKETRHEYHTEIQVDVVVLTHDQLARLIQEEAARLATFMLPPLRCFTP